MKKIQYIFSLIVMAAMMVSCSQDFEVEDNQGYLRLKIQSFVSTNTPDDGTRAALPSDYDAKQLAVEIKDATGKTVKSTNDFDNDAAFQNKIVLEAGTYTVEAHSANWDGSGSGFDVPYYYGSTKVTIEPKNSYTAKITCTLANVKLTVTYDESIKENFQAATTTITSSIAGVSPLEFIMNKTEKSGYIPAGDFDAKLEVVNKGGDVKSLVRSFTGVNPRDHYILNFRLANEGFLGGNDKPSIDVDIDESTNTYTYTFEVPRKSSTSLVARQANAWSTFAMLNGAVTAKTSSFNQSGLSLQWRLSGTENWNELDNSQLTVDASDNISTTLKGLTPKTSYEYRICYDDNGSDVVSEVMSFTTEEQIALYNGGFEQWTTSGSIVYANESNVSYWDSSNPGSTLNGVLTSNNLTTGVTSPVHGGSQAAKLGSKVVASKFAAASLYIGKFGELIGTSGAKLEWGTPFTSRPIALKGFMQYAPASVSKVGSGVPAEAPASGEPDQCGIFCALVTEKLAVDNTDMSTFPDWDTDSRVVAYGELPIEQNVNSNGEWKEVNIPFVYRNLTRKPTHLVVVFSSSKYGDYFHGGAGSTLYLDDFELVYGDTPSVK